MVSKDYETPEITVHWESELCIHTARCLHALPEVFDVQARPWIDLSKASAVAVADAVAQCPTGALSFTSATIDEPAATPVGLRPIRGGPMVVSGPVEVIDAEGAVVRTATRACLCRCGNSGNQPFCDNSHRSRGFDEPELRARPEATAPDEVCPPQPGFGD